MTRKDFQLIANVLKASSTSPMNRCVIKELAVTFASELTKVNPRFNAQRFVNACTPENPKLGYVEVRDLTPEEEAQLDAKLREGK
tara:strand:- start:394 stop:648 length:255 start_codon:yes stop_codon:yes gene_type:complete